MKPYKIIHNYVYVVYECEKTVAWNDEDICAVGGIVHGVYINRDEAEGKKHKLNLENYNRVVPHGYICVLKKPVLGKPVANALSNLLRKAMARL